jgi:beta-1,4-mannosyl-glycoprotein beta-1,4-N-acetylglucosaminyltransferase
MIYDCFTYWNEDELLILRLQHLWDHVDKFVIVESNITHRGRPKDWNLEKLDLEWAKEKIIHIKKEIDVSNFDVDHRSSSYDPESPFWKIENLQRNTILEGLCNASPDDTIMIGDLDEFPTHASMKIVEELSDRFECFSMGMSIFNYYLNVRQNTSETWIGTVVGKFKNLTSPQEWRNLRGIFRWEGNMGYHFTWMGEKNVYLKFKNTSHDEIEHLGTLENIKKCFLPDSEGNFDDIFGRGIKSREVDVSKDPNYPSCIKKDHRLFYKSGS